MVEHLSSMCSIPSITHTHTQSKLKDMKTARYNTGASLPPLCMAPIRKLPNECFFTRIASPPTGRGGLGLSYSCLGQGLWL
jgi:hypothetical protein